MKGTEILLAGLQTTENCETNNQTLVDLAKAYESTGGVGGGSVTFKCCNWSCCNYNTSSMSLAEAPITSMEQLAGKTKL